MFAASYFPKTYFPGTYFPPLGITSDACALATQTLIAFGFDRVGARNYLIQRAAEYRVGYRGSLGTRRSHRGDAILYTEAALCLDATIDGEVIRGLAEAFKL